MNSNDLFSFLDEVPPEDVDHEEDDSMQTDPVPVSSKIAQKRKAPPVPDGRTEDATVDDEPGPSTPKKLRVSSPKPIVLDDFETEAKREVAASAGLTGSVDAGTRLELKHQVYKRLPPLICEASKSPPPKKKRSSYS
jgi:ATP-dependent RNA helicase DOB1